MSISKVLIKIYKMLNNIHTKSYTQVVSHLFLTFCIFVILGII